MPKISIQTKINAPVELCFDLSRSLDLHQISTKHTHEHVIAGKDKGLLGLNETVTWKAKHFGFWLTLTSKITSFNKPTSFVDEMTNGPFKSLYHLHEFNYDGEMTIMSDTFTFESPVGILGRLFNQLTLTSYLKRLLEERNKVIKEYAESDRWKSLIH